MSIETNKSSTLSAVLLLVILELAVSCRVSRDGYYAYDYLLDWRGDRLGVTLDFMPTSPDSTVLSYGDLDWGGQGDIFACVRNLGVQGVDGFSVDSAARTVTLRYGRMSRLKVRYSIFCQVPAGDIDCPTEMFRPNTTDTCLYVHGINLFLREEGKEAGSTARIRWRRTPPFPTFCMYNPAHGLADADGALEDFLPTLIVGDRDLRVDTLTIRGVDNYLVTALRSHVDYNREQIRDYFTRFYTHIVRFWGETDLRPYSVVLYPFSRIPHDISGTGLGGGFCARYSAFADTVLTADRVNTISHEIGHNWISADMDNQWFGEGFNELQTVYMNIAAGITTPLEGVAYLNDGLGKLSRSEIRNMPNEDIRVHFWELGDYSWIPYWRGMVYGLRLLGQMEASTGEKNVYARLMHALKPHLGHITAETFLSVCSSFMDAEVLEDEFGRFIMKGESIPLSGDVLPSGLSVRTLGDGVEELYISDEQAFMEHFSSDGGGS